MSDAGDPPDGRTVPNLAPWQALSPALARSGLSFLALHGRYLALGGCATAAALADHFSRGRDLARGEHDLAVLALNERFIELNDSERLPYSTPGA